MTAVADKKSFADQFDQFAQLAQGPFQSLKERARQRFEALSLPGKKSEDWRFTNIAPLLKLQFEAPSDAVTISDSLLPAATRADSLRLVLINGFIVTDESKLGDLPRGVRLGNAHDHAEKAGKLLGQLAEFEDHVFTALNTSLFGDVAYLQVDDNVVLERPVEIVHVSLPGSAPIVHHPRTLITLGKNSQATVVEWYVGSGGEAYLANAVTEVAVDAGANLDHYKVQQETARGHHLANMQVTLEKQSVFSSHYLALGAAWVRNEARVRFYGEHGEATLNGLYVGTGKQHVDSLTVIDHAMPNCVSHELYKGVLGDNAHGVFNGKIFVRPDAQKTDAKQSNKVLLLSESATINTKPQLEIYADDVKCTHGATVGQLDAEQLFYLQARGLGRAEARSLLTFAFANDLVSRIKIEALRDRLEDLLVKKQLSDNNKT